MTRTTIYCLLAAALLAGCTTRQGQRELTWEQGGYADPEGASFIGYHGPAHRRVEDPGS